jgi:two-component system response regulator HydG
MMARSDLIDIEDLPEYIRAPGPDNGDPEYMSLEEVEHRHVRRVLENVGGNKQVAAQILQISRATLYRVLGKKEPDKPTAE